MIFWIILAVMAGSIFWMRHTDYDNLIPIAFTVIFGAAALFLAVVICINIIPADGHVESSKARYESLVYQYENNMYDNDNDIGKKQLMNQIQHWNEDLAFNKEMQRDFWIGIFIPNVFDQFKYIDLDTMKG